MKLTDRLRAEIEVACKKQLDALAADLYGIRRHVKIFSEGAQNAEDTWVGTCTLCKAHHVTNLNPLKTVTMPIPCGEVGPVQCTGTVLLDPNWEALLAAYKIGGWEALHGRDQGTMTTFDVKITSA